MPYLVLGIAVIVGLVLVVRGLRGMDRRNIMLVLRWLVVTVVIGGVVIFAIERGIAATLGAAAFLLPVLLRWRGFARWVRNMGGPTPGQSTGVNTRYLRMSLDHDSGVLDGTVLQGPFRGRRLGEMTRPELIALLAECRVEDEESATILEAFLDRVFGGEWREEPIGGAGARQAGAAAGSGPAWNGGAMTREEAAEVLGVSPDAGPDEVKSAHHKLMLKLHPDQGGSNYLAAKINQARNVLLGGRR